MLAVEVSGRAGDGEREFGDRACRARLRARPGTFSQRCTLDSFLGGGDAIVEEVGRPERTACWTRGASGVVTLSRMYVHGPIDCFCISKPDNELLYET